MLLKLLSFCLFLHSVQGLQRENFPIHNPNSVYVISYTTTKDFPNGSLRKELLNTLKTYFDLQIFLETGTHFGETAAVAAQVFPQVISLEIFPEFYQIAKNRLVPYPNATVILGDSGILLQNLLSGCNKSILFYLDGHFDGGKSGKGSANTPILKELAAIRNTNHCNSVILIDDICDFQPSLFPQQIANTCFEGYPDLSELLEELLKINPQYQFCFLGNALLAFPPTDTVTVSPVASACAIDRLSTFSDLFSEEELRQCENAISHADRKEKMELLHYYDIYAPFEYSQGWRSFSSLWFGLIMENNGQKEWAQKAFHAAAIHSLPGWRIEAHTQHRSPM